MAYRKAGHRRGRGYIPVSYTHLDDLVYGVVKRQGLRAEIIGRGFYRQRSYDRLRIEESLIALAFPIYDEFLEGAQVFFSHGGVKIFQRGKVHLDSGALRDMKTFPAVSGMLDLYIFHLIFSSRFRPVLK